MNFIMKCMKFIETFGENSRRETSLLIINALWSRISTQFRDFLLSRPRPGVAGPVEHLGIGGIFSIVVVVDRGTLSHISNLNFQFWAVLGIKKPNCHKYATFEGNFFMFL